MWVQISLHHVRKGKGDLRTVLSHQLVLENRNNAQGVGADDSGVHSRNNQGESSHRAPDGGFSTKSKSPLPPAQGHGSMWSSPVERDINRPHAVGRKPKWVIL